MERKKPPVGLILVEILTPRLYKRWLDREYAKDPDKKCGQIITYVCDEMGSEGGGRDSNGKPLWAIGFDSWPLFGSHPVLLLDGKEYQVPAWVEILTTQWTHESWMQGSNVSQLRERFCKVFTEEELETCR